MNKFKAGDVIKGVWAKERIMVVTRVHDKYSVYTNYWGNVPSANYDLVTTIFRDEFNDTI